jgi:glutamyl-tRNA synthetase
MYDRACRTMSTEQIARCEASGAPRAIRFLAPDGHTGFHDLVHGQITFDNARIEDFVILRSDRQPTYHLSVVVDDIDMAITSFAGTTISRTLRNTCCCIARSASLFRLLRTCR